MSTPPRSHWEELKLQLQPFIVSFPKPIKALPEELDEPPVKGKIADTNNKEETEGVVITKKIQTPSIHSILW